ncbi:hypothetical protein HY230_05915 [Candidatus Acetothermia bacterium]|nr:hypothetical protein [Candidatus Acetothermia bacterium]
MLRRSLIVFCLFAGMIGVFSSAQPDQPSTSPVRKEANIVLTMVNNAVKMAVLAANGELFVPSGVVSLPNRQAEAQEILNFLVGKNGSDYKTEYKNQAKPPLPIAASWDGIGIQEHTEKLNSELEGAISRGEIPVGSAKLLRATVLEIMALLKKSVELAKDAIAAPSQNERQAKEILVDLKLTLTATRGSREDPLLEGGMRSVMGNLPTR